MMSFTSQLQSYAVHRMLAKTAVYVLVYFSSFTIGRISASTASMATSVTVHPPSIVFSPTAISPTKTTLLPSSTSSTSLPHNVSFQISIQLTDTTWSDELFNNKTPSFLSLSSNLTSTVSGIVKSVGDASVEILEFKPGSVIAVFKVTALSSQESGLKNRLIDEMRDGKLGAFAVEPVLYSGRVFDVILKLNIVCNDSATDKGFVQKGSLENAIITKLNSSNKSVTAANIRLVDCPQDDNENITIVTVRVQLKDLSAVNPNKELRSLKDAVDGGRVGNFSVVPEWKSYIPGEKLFHLKATVVPGSANALRNKTVLEALIREKFKGKSNFRYANVEVPDNTTLEIDIGMDSSTSELPFIALDVFARELQVFWPKLGNLKLFRNTIRVTVEPKSLTKKTFEVTFAQNVPNCDPGKIADSNSSHFKNLSDGAREFIDSILKADKKVGPFYLETEVMRLLCLSNTTVRSVSFAYLKPTAEDKIGLLFPLLKCKVEPGIYDGGVKIQLKTPTSVLVRGIWNVLQGVWIHWVCFKPPKPKPPTQEPTDLYTTTGPTTAITTGTISNTTTTTRGPLPTTESKPQLFLKVGLGMTWGEFCSKQEIFKERIAGNLEDSNGTELSPDRIIYANVAENCADPSKHDEMAEVWFYVSKAGSKDLDESLTLKAFELFSMFFENANTKQLGPDFEEKVINVVLAGSEASKYETKTTCGLSSLHIILIAVAGAVGLFLMLLSCCCLFCCSKSRKRKSPYKYESKHHHAMHIIHVDAGAKDTEDRDKNANKEENKFVGEKEGRRDIKEDISDGGHENDGYDCLQDEGNNSKSHKSDNKETSNDITAVFNERQVNIHQDISARERSLDKGVNSATGEAGVHQGERSHSYEDLNTGNADYHIYESVSKASEIADKNSSRIYINVANVPVTTSPVTCTVNVNGVDRNGKKKSGLHFSSSSTVGNAQESPKIGPQCTSVCTTKVYADPKNQDRRGSYIQPLADEDVALTHNTGTVGIVALAIRNKNESKKETEFKNLSRDAPRDDVKYHPDTANKNRNPDVLPVSRTRVKLSTQPDYINANWIRDHKGQRCYIATQHPLKETMGDFWQMVWDQKANTVVMVNNEEKNDSVDFTEYLPKGIGMSKRFGSIEVTVKQITDKADYTLTVLSIAKTKTESPREVSHMRFTSWKERAMPNVALFVGFVTASKEERKKYGDAKAPTIVHCSDGLGFTGVYIALDIGIKSHEESKTSVVDVFELSKNLRHDRHGIVCSLDHYNFIYQALYEYTVNCDKSEQRVLDASL
ncbi:uncharacterized protein [Montipora capricornis]|uniref:uncharacterized protein n=1 Tax=Montipora capricornis TaxID=246305 RepID=UPI0035F1026F